MIEFEQKRIEQHAECESEHREIDLHVAYAEQADRNGDGRSDCDRDQKNQLEIRDPCRRHVAGRVGAGGQKHGVPERQQTRVAKQEIEAEQRDRVSHRGEHQDDVVGSRDEGEKENNQKQQSRQRQSPFQSSCAGCPGGDRCRRGCHAVLARRPCGRTMSTVMTIT